MVLPSRLGCPLSLKTPNMGNTGSNQLPRRPQFPPRASVQRSLRRRFLPRAVIARLSSRRAFCFERLDALTDAALDEVDVLDEDGRPARRNFGHPALAAVDAQQLRIGAVVEQVLVVARRRSHRAAAVPGDAHHQRMVGADRLEQVAQAAAPSNPAIVVGDVR